jgi:hypothetical protein
MGEIRRGIHWGNKVELPFWTFWHLTCLLLKKHYFHLNCRGSISRFFKICSSKVNRILQNGCTLFSMKLDLKKYYCNKYLKRIVYSPASHVKTTKHFSKEKDNKTLLLLNIFDTEEYKCWWKKMEMEKENQKMYKCIPATDKRRL